MATEAHAAEGATGYIIHHLTSLRAGEGFWALHIDTLFFSVLFVGCELKRAGVKVKDELWIFIRPPIA